MTIFEDHQPVSAPVDSDFAGRGGAAAIQSVVRIFCAATNKMGTGFLHHSGYVITAEHVIRDCADCVLILSDATQIAGKIVATDPIRDLALVSAAQAIKATIMPISTANEFQIGAQVSTWGYPDGYRGYSPMLSVGYLAAHDSVMPQNAPSPVTRLVVNAAFNSGNSGGPLLLLETGEVIGVVVSKVAPMSDTARLALAALEQQGSGVIYTVTAPDGTQSDMSEAQIAAIILNELKAQVQLVIGHAALAADLRAFLQQCGLTP